MKTSYTLLIAMLFTTFSFAQTETCDCKKDLDYLVKKIKKMPSYKEQIRNQKEDAFQTLNTELASKMENNIPVETCYRLLSQQIDFIKDYHAYVKLNEGFVKKGVVETQEAIESFKNSDHFKKHPRTQETLVQLEASLSKKPDTSIEGIYQHGEEYVLGIRKNEKTNTFDGIVLESKNPLWEPGQIKFTATENTYGNYDLYYYDSDTYRPYYANNMQFENMRLWSFKKEENKNNFEFIENDTINWGYEVLQGGTPYVRMRTFSGSTSNRRAQRKFFAELENKLTAGNLILDLRSNGGGSYEVSDPFLKLFKQKGVKIYVITNQFTGSNAEQFTAKLRELEGTVHVGQTTRGIIAYGRDKEASSSPSGYFTFYTTDMNFHEPFFAYEGKGVVPEIKLEFDKDWIQQTLALLNHPN